LIQIARYFEIAAIHGYGVAEEYIQEDTEELP